jgi:ubiquinone/menaquinone biosynthesis C-methylase UbiE
MRFTGERLVPGFSWLENMIEEELARLSLVGDYIPRSVALDVGCGTGHATNYLAKYGSVLAVGVDISPEAINFARSYYSHPTLRFAPMDSLALAFPDNMFDLVCSLDVIEHIQNPDKYLAEIVRVLKAGGKYFLTTPNKRFTSLQGDPSWEFHVHEFFLEELRDTLGGHFSSIEIYGAQITAYDQHPIRKLTNSRLSAIKHILPAKIRVGFSSRLRHLIKPHVDPEDIKLSTENLDNSKVFLAICQP